MSTVDRFHLRACRELRVGRSGREVYLAVYDANRPVRGQLTVDKDDLPVVVRLLRGMLPKRGQRSKARAISSAAPANAADG